MKSMLRKQAALCVSCEDDVVDVECCSRGNRVRSSRALQLEPLGFGLEEAVEQRG